MTETKTQFPMIKWAQRKDRLFITINVVHSKKPIVDLTDGKRIKYQGTDGTVNYAFDMELYDEISKDESKYTLESRNIFLNIKKKTPGPYWPRLLKDEKKHPWIEVDWMYYAEEDEEEPYPDDDDEEEKDEETKTDIKEGNKNEVIKN